MSVLIKGMEMPENCEKCPFLDYEQGFCFASGEKRKSGWYVSTLYSGSPEFNTMRNPKCPLIEVPTPHGRLIDADALKKRIAATYYSQDEKDKAPMDDIPWMNGCNTKVKEVCGMTDDAPTVIEAEEGEG